MGDRRPGRDVVVLAAGWGDGSEEAFVTRQLAGALSRSAAVHLLVPGPAGPPVADGLFDRSPVGPTPTGDRWPSPDQARWPEGWAPDLVLVDRATSGVAALLARFAAGVPMVTTSTAAPPGELPPAVVLEVGPPRTAAGEPGASVPTHIVGLHVPVHPLAAERRHNGFGFTGYVLVLTDRPPVPAHPVGPVRPDGPTAAVAWLAAGLPDRDLVVVEDGLATAWRGRALRGVVPIDTRTDLWRLMAHARLTVDLAPGELLARECVESARYGTPVVVPAGTAAARFAALGGGLWYRNVAELLACVEALDDQGRRDILGAQGRQQADAWYGDPAAFVDRVGSVLEAVLRTSDRR